MKFHYRLVKLIVSLVLVGSYFFLPKYGFTSFDGNAFDGFPVDNFLYPLSHANIWHLLANILCLWMLRCKMHIVATYLIAVVCSFLPSFSIYDCVMQGGFSALSEPTYGFSGILFAMVGVSWGKIHRLRDMIVRNKWYLIIPAFLPHVNFLIHIYCLFAGYLYGTLCVKKSENS